MANVSERPITYYIRIIKSKKWVLFLVFLLTVAATAAGSFLWPPIYESTATILLDYANPNPLDVQVMPGSGSFSVEYMLTEKRIVESRSVALKVIEGLRLMEHPSLRQLYERSKLSGRMRKVFFWKKQKDYRQWLLDFLAESLIVMPYQDSRILAITVRTSDPNFSAALANAYAWAYTKYHLELKVVPLKESVEWFSKKVEELRRDVELKEKGLEEYKASKGVVNPDDRYNIATQKLNQLNADLVQAENKFYETSIKMNLVKDIKQKGGNYDSLPEVMSNGLIQNLKVDKIRLEKEMSDLLNRVGKNHPHYAKTVAELQTVKDKIKNEINNIVEAVVTDYESAKKRRAALVKALEEQKERVLNINKETFGLNMLNMEAQTARRVYDTLLTKFSETTLRGDINRTNVIVIDKAAPAVEPTTPKIFLNMVLSLFGGLTLGVVAVFMLEFFDNTIKGEDDIEADLGLVLLGVIPKK